MPRTLHALPGLLFALALAAAGPARGAGDRGPGTLHDDHGNIDPPVQGTDGQACQDGVSSGFACRNVELLGRLTLAELGGGSGSDSWGWKDPQTGRYYALFARSSGTSFVDVTDPTDPVLVGNLSSAGGSQPWRDVKTYADHAFIVADAVAGHGMQVFDLTRLRGVTAPQTFTADARYTGFGPAHNVAIDEATGFAYAVGTDTCDGGLHIVDIRNPKNPEYAGCYEGDGYTHDVHCVSYDGPDEDYAGREVCFASNEDSLTLVDVTAKDAPSLIARLAYPFVGYSHLGWLTDSHRYFLLGDELDELGTGANARTLVFDVSDLDAPAYVGAHHGSHSTIDHNLYARGPFVFQANYQAGLRILLMEDLARAELREIGYFDTFPEGDDRGFDGAWNVYPFFDNGTLLVSDMNRGLFVLGASLPASEASPINGRTSGVYTADGYGDQGLVFLVTENNDGPYAFFTWFLYLGGEPFWITGGAPFEYGASDIDIPTQRLEGLEFLTPSDARATRIDIGTLNVHRHHCQAVHVTWDFGALGTGDLHMTRLGGIEGRECRANR